MAYSPLGQGRLAAHPLLQKIGRARGLSAAQIAIAWALREPDVVAIPKSVQSQRIEENFRAAEIRLKADELKLLDRAFPAPRSKQPLETT